MNLQIIAIRSDVDSANDQNVTHYQLLNWDSFTIATLSKPQVVAMVEGGTEVFVINPNGEQIPCAVNTQNSASNLSEKWLQGQVDGEWTDDVLALPHIRDINGANKVRRYTTKGTSEVDQNE